MENFKMYLEQLIPEKDSLKLVRTEAEKCFQYARLRGSMDTA